MSKQYIVVVGKDLEELQKAMNEGAAVEYRVVGGMMPVYVPALFSMKLHGYAALMEKVSRA